MGKKSKCRRQKEAIQDAIQIYSNLQLEYLLSTIISEYMQTTTVPAGIVKSEPKLTSEGYEIMCLKPLCHFQKGCPQNFQDFFASATSKHYVTERDIAFSWWSRSRLRYSCSTIAATLVRFLIPYMKANGTTELYSQSMGTNIQMGDLEIFTLSFIPEQTHGFKMVDSYEKIELVEATIEFRCYHNVLKCKKSGIIIDCTLGQFTGKMKPYLFKKVEDFFSEIPGKVTTFVKTNENAIDEQVSRDNLPYRLKGSIDAMPANFTKRVFRACHEKKKFCWNCKGTASAGLGLKRCSKCKKTFYCSKHCQKLHWKTHQQYCSS